MENTKKIAKSNTAHPMASDASVEVLYQRMGDKWYAFSVIDDEIFFGSVDEETLKEVKPAKSARIAGKA